MSEQIRVDAKEQVYERSVMAEKLRHHRWIRTVTALSALVCFGALHFSKLLVFPFALFLISPLFEMFVNQPHEWAIKNAKDLRTVFICNQVLDIAAIMWAIYFTGMFGKVFLVLLYPVVFITTGIFLTPVAAFLMANLALVSFVALFFLEYTGVLPSMPDNGIYIPDSKMAVSILITGALFNIIAFDASLLAGTLKKIDKKLRRSQERFRDIVENTKEWIWETDQEGKYTYSNLIVWEILGYAPDEIIGKPFYEFIHFGEKKMISDIIMKKYEGKEPFRDIVDRKTDKNGKTIWISSSGTPLFDENREFKGYRGVSRDVTLQKDVEMELKNRMEELQKFNRFAVDRELKMKAMKEEIERLRKANGDK